MGRILIGIRDTGGSVRVISVLKKDMDEKIPELEEILVENERRLSALNAPYDPGSPDDREESERIREDFAYWAARYARIKPKGGGDDVPFILNPPQRKLVAALEQMRREDKPIRLILLKARQWGGSTCVQLYMAWLQFIHEKGLNSLIIAHYRTAASEIKDMFDRLLHNYPKDMMDVSTQRVGNDGTVRIMSRNCKVKIGTAENPDSVRGGDYNLVHCSEVGLWKTTKLKTPEMIVRSACSGVLFKPLTMIVYESTANGTGTFFHKEFLAASRGESQFAPLFVAWYEIPQYSLPFEDGERESFVKTLLEGRENTEATSDRRQPGKYLWQLWKKGATLEAIKWYVAERSKYSDHGQMAAEYPSDETEAFVHSGARVFDKYKVEDLRANCKNALKRGEITGDLQGGTDSLRNLKFVEDLQGAVQVWAFPEEDDFTRVSDRYAVAVDIGGRSAGSDWSVIAVFDRWPMTKGEGPEVVAQWRGHTDYDLLAWKAARIAKFYDNALLIIESNTLETRDPERGPEGNQSLFLFNRLREAYPNLYARKGSEEAVSKGQPGRYGFHTNVSTKPMIISTLVELIREGGYIERDEKCLDEYLAYEQKDNGSFGALPGHHDDILMTRAIGLHICLHDMPMPRRYEKGVKGNAYRRHGNKGSYASF